MDIVVYKIMILKVWSKSLPTGVSVDALKPGLYIIPGRSRAGTVIRVPTVLYLSADKIDAMQYHIRSARYRKLIRPRVRVRNTSGQMLGRRRGRRKFR